jgi:hypothetical protein
VTGALGEVFPHYAIYAPSDHDVLIIASDAPLPEAAQPSVFEHPGLAKELWTVHMLTAGDLDARYVGKRATLEPLFASYRMPANSDYAPVLDLNAARQRFMETSATDLVALLNLGVPLLEMLEPTRSRRAVNPLFQGAYAFERVEATRVAWYARNFLAHARAPAPQAIPTQLQKDLELVKLRLVECRDPRELDIWLHSALRVAQAMNPYLAPDDLGAVWLRIVSGRCFASLADQQRQWITLFRAVAARDAARMAEVAARLLDEGGQLGAEAREYLLLAGMTGSIAAGKNDTALELWRMHGERARSAGTPAFRLLRCHARLADCAQEFR